MPNFATTNESLLTRDSLQRLTGFSFNNILQNPDHVLWKLRMDDPADEWRFYQDIEADSMVNTCQLKIIRAVTALKWELYQGNSDDKTFEVCKLAFDKLYRSNYLRNAIQSVIRTISYGRQFVLVDWRYDNNYWLPSALDTMPLELFRYDTDGNIQYRQADSLTYQTVDPYRVINPRYNPSWRNKYGESVLSKCYWPVFFKKNAIQFMNSFLERDGMPWVITNYDRNVLGLMYPGLSEEDAVNRLVGVIATKVGDGILVQPKEMETDIKAPNLASNGANYKIMIDLCNEDISRIWTGQTSTTMSVPGQLGSDTQGQNDMRLVINDAKEIVCEVMNILISWIHEVNFSGSNVELPYFGFYEEKEVNIELATMLKTLKEAGVGLKDVEWVANETGIPVDQLEIISVAAAPGGNNNTEVQAKLKPVIDKIKGGMVMDYNTLYSEVKQAGFEGKAEIDSVIVDLLKEI